MSSSPTTCTRVAIAEVNGSNTTSGEKMNCPGGIWPKVQHIFKMRLEPEAHRVLQCSPRGAAQGAHSLGYPSPSYKTRKGKTPVPSLIIASIWVSRCQPHPVEHGADSSGTLAQMVLVHPRSRLRLQPHRCAPVLDQPSTAGLPHPMLCPAQGEPSAASA